MKSSTIRLAKYFTAAAASLVTLKGCETQNQLDVARNKNFWVNTIQNCPSADSSSKAQMIKSLAGEFQFSDKQESGMTDNNHPYKKLNFIVVSGADTARGSYMVTISNGEDINKPVKVVNKVLTESMILETKNQVLEKYQQTITTVHNENVAQPGHYYIAPVLKK